jgi:hypothetical protein
VLDFELAKWLLVGVPPLLKNRTCLEGTSLPHYHISENHVMSQTGFREPRERLDRHEPYLSSGVKGHSNEIIMPLLDELHVLRQSVQINTQSHANISR